MRVKEKGLAISVCNQYLSNCVLLQVFPVLSHVIGITGVCFVFSACLVGAMYFVHTYVPETSGKSLEEIASIFDGTTGSTSLELSAVPTSGSPPPTPPRARGGSDAQYDRATETVAVLQSAADAI
jgi:hypothetical protein